MNYFIKLMQFNYIASVVLIDPLKKPQTKIHKLKKYI